MSNGESQYKLEHYSIIVLKTSKYDKLKDIKGLKVGYYQNTAGAKDANNKLKKEVEISLEEYTASNLLAQDLLNSTTNAIIVEDSIKNIIEEEIENFEKTTKVIYSFTIKVETKSTAKDVNVTKKPFAIYISGIDTYGEISSVSRSDVNIVMVVNPKTKQVLLVSIPRDYYVQLHGTTGVKDKLTHAGIYGIDMSIKTLEDLLQMDINYYIKVNFTSVEDIIDALGGVEVYSEYTFISYSGYSFKKGYNSVNGKQALDFARTRKAFADGDRQRGKNQQALIAAMLKKATSKSIITKYNSLLNSVNGKYQTNMSTKKMTSLIKMQLNDMSPWNVTSVSLKGIDSRNYTYTYYQILYVMEPDEDSVNEAIEMIDKVISGETLENSYNDEIATSNKVNQTTVKKNNYNETNNAIKSNSNIETSKNKTISSQKNNDVTQEQEKIETTKPETSEIETENEETLKPSTEEETNKIEEPIINNESPEEKQESTQESESGLEENVEENNNQENP